MANKAKSCGIFSFQFFFSIERYLTAGYNGAYLTRSPIYLIVA